MDPRFVLFASVLLLGAFPPVAASGPSPEINDVPGDADMAGALDITAVSIDADNPAMVDFHLDVPKLRTTPAATGLCASAGNCVSLSSSFQVEFIVLDPNGGALPFPEYSGTILVYRHNAPAGNQAVIGHRDANGTRQLGRPVASSLVGTEIILSVPRNDTALRIPVGPTPGAYRLTQLVASSAPEICLPPLPQQPPQATIQACTAIPAPGKVPNAPPTTQESQWDVAPDSGYGRDFVFPAPPPAPAPNQDEPDAPPEEEEAKPAPSPTIKPSSAPSPTTTTTTAPPRTETTSATASATMSDAAPVPAYTMTGSAATPAPGVTCLLGTLAGIALIARRRLSA